MTPERYRRINQLFDAAVGLPPAERAALLDRECAGDPPLRKAVERMFEADSQSGAFLEQPPADIAAGLMASRPERFGPYELLEQIGSGGMGEVYRARDTRLGREVAIKRLPADLAISPDYIQRLRREASLLATLNHPNIATVHDIGEQNDAYYLVLELVPGKTLAEMLAKGSLPLSQALPICRQIAEALEAAHERGIVHRDLKPANVKVTPEGKVKLLDFGVAKTDTGESQDLALTREGLVVGTVPYMSPEQACGKRVDKRSDIWSFGCVLYETLTGRPLFQADTTSEIVAAILRDDPPLDKLPENVPPSLVRMLKRCLQREPANRLRDIGDARIEIDEVLAERPPAQPQARPERPRLVAAIAAGAILATIVCLAAWIVWLRPKPTPASMAQVQRLTDFVGVEEAPAISPDGKSVAFAAYEAGKRQIWVRLLAGGLPLQLTHDDADHQRPRWTPDSSSLIYYVPPQSNADQGAIWEIPALGGTPRRIVSSVGEADVSHDGKRLAVIRLRDGKLELATVSRDPAQQDPRTITELPQDLYEYPRWSPDDRFIAFEQTIVTFESRISVVSSGGGQVRQVARADDARGLAWFPDSSGIVYASSFGSTLPYPPAYNLRAIGLDGKGDRPLTFGEVSYTEPDVHSSGRIVASRIRNQSDIWKIPVAGPADENTRGAIQITHQTGQAQTPSVSPDGREAVYLSDSGGHANLWIAKTDGSGLRQITFERDPNTLVGVPVWSPSGKQIVFIMSHGGHTTQWLIRPDGGGLRKLIDDAIWVYWSIDGSWLYYVTTRNGVFFIEKTPVEGGSPVVVRDHAFAPAISADGSTLWYGGWADRSGASREIELRRASPENGPPTTLARFAASRVPVSPYDLNFILSPDGVSLAGPLTDGGTTNLWLLPSGGGPMRRVTDFQGRPVMIARRISWSPDGKHIYAAVADNDADIVLLEGLVK